MSTYTLVEDQATCILTLEVKKFVQISKK